MSNLAKHGLKVCVSAIKQHYADALNAGTVSTLPAEERAEVKRLLESGQICFSVSGAWIVRRS